MLEGKGIIIPGAVNKVLSFAARRLPLVLPQNGA
jgi:hypothetical protein